MKESGVNETPARQILILIPGFHAGGDAPEDALRTGTGHDIIPTGQEWE